MRVGLLIDRWDPRRGGAEGALDQLARHLLERGHEVHLFGVSCVRDPRAPFHAIRAGGSLRVRSRGAYERRLGRSLVAAARGAGCDVTLGVRHLERVDVLWLHGGAHRATLAARRAAARHGRGPGSPTAVVPRGRHRVFDELERAALTGGAGVVVCPSSLVRDELLALYPDSAPRLVVVPNGVDLERFHPRARSEACAALRRELGVVDELPIVSFVARNPRLKGLPALFAGLARVEARAHLVVAGPRRPGLWRRRARRAGLDPARVHQRTWLEPLLLAAGADLCAHPTWRDTSALVVLEALACGTPVVTSRFAGAAEDLPAAAGRVVADPGDAAELGAALAEQLARVAAGVDRGAVRAAVRAHDAGLTLARLEEILGARAAAR